MTLIRIAHMMGMKSFDNWGSFKYLGLPISSGAHKENHWQEVDDKIKAKLSSWGGRWLNYFRKLVLINSTLSYLPIY